MQRRTECSELRSESLEEWKRFRESIQWNFLVNEFKARDQYITNLLRTGDNIWSTEEMRARLNELEFVIQTPDAIILELELLKTKNKDKE
jgi:hypothetical protein